MPSALLLGSALILAPGWSSPVLHELGSVRSGTEEADGDLDSEARSPTDEDFPKVTMVVSE